MDIDIKIKRRKLFIALFHIAKTIFIYALTFLFGVLLIFSLGRLNGLGDVLSILLISGVELFLLYEAYKTTKHIFIFMKGEISVTEGYLFSNDKMRFIGSGLRGGKGLGVFNAKTVITKDVIDELTIYKTPEKLIGFEWRYIRKTELFTFGERVRIYHYKGTNIPCYVEKVNYS